MKRTFEEIVEPHRAQIRLRCYRMLGSSSDVDDMVQETFTRAFRSWHTLADDALVRTWLYRIATNVCLDESKARSRRVRGPELGPPSDPDLPPAPATPEDEWIEPCPSSWLEGNDPASAYTLEESVALAFVAALQVLTPSQRAVLLLRDVVGLTAEETAAALETTVSAVNSALSRIACAAPSRRACSVPCLSRPTAGPRSPSIDAGTTGRHASSPSRCWRSSGRACGRSITSWAPARIARCSQRDCRRRWLETEVWSLEPGA